MQNCFKNWRAVEDQKTQEMCAYYFFDSKGSISESAVSTLGDQARRAESSQN